MFLRVVAPPAPAAPAAAVPPAAPAVVPAAAPPATALPAAKLGINCWLSIQHVCVDDVIEHLMPLCKRVAISRFLKVKSCLENVYRVVCMQRTVTLNSLLSSVSYTEGILL